MKSRYTNVKYHCEISWYFSAHCLPQSLRNYKEEAKIKPSEKALAMPGKKSPKPHQIWVGIWDVISIESTLAQHFTPDWWQLKPCYVTHRIKQIYLFVSYRLMACQWNLVYGTLRAKKTTTGCALYRILARMWSSSVSLWTSPTLSRTFARSGFLKWTTSVTMSRLSLLVRRRTFGMTNTALRICTTERWDKWIVLKIC